MLQTAFRPSCMNRASVFEWYKRFKEGRECVRDDERCGRSKEVNTPELIGQIKNFMDKDRRVSRETISAQFNVSVGTVHTIIREELKMRKICVKFVPKVLRGDQKKKTLPARRRSSWSIQIQQFLILWGPVMKAESSTMTKRQNSLWKHPGSSRMKKARQSKSTHKHLMIPFFWQHWIPTGQTVNKEYYVEVLREFRKRFRRKKPELFKSGQWHFHLDNAPVHKSILVTDYLSKMGIKTVPQPPYSADLAPCDFCLLSSQAVVMRQLRRWKGLWRRSLTHSHKRTSMGPSRNCWNGTISSLQPEEIPSKRNRVSCVYYQ